MIAVFLGPTLSRARALELLPEATLFPPVSQGDVWRVCAAKPLAIGIIDGYFDRVPAVWHKEILWALSQGVHVFGAASMGALRAAELHPFGMIGVGKVFEDFRSGSLERDDEVAILHAPAEHEYRPLSVALVDVRASLDAAVAEGVLDSATAQLLLESAAALFYPDRCWPAILQAASQRVAGAALELLSKWLPQGAFSQKARDASALLTQMRALLHAKPPSHVAEFEFENTQFWRQACCIDGRWGAIPGAPHHDAVLDELRLDGPAAYQAAMIAGAERALALDRAAAQSFTASQEQVDAVWAELIHRHQLDSADARRRWCDEQSLGPQAFLELLRAEARVQHVRQRLALTLPDHIADHLKLQGTFGALRKRADEKNAAAALGEVPSRSPVAGPWEWYYEQRFGRAVPENRAAQVKALGLAHDQVWSQILERERQHLGAEGQQTVEAGTNDG